MQFSKYYQTRRSNYNLSAECPIPDEEIQQIIEDSIKYAPSAFNSQSSRVVLLKGKEHKALWEIAMNTLKAIVPEKSFKATEDKINSFAAAYGTILYFEDQETIRHMQKQFPTYSLKFPEWSEQHSGILQYMIWLSLEQAGLGANIQHYNPLIDDQVKSNWNLPDSWRLIAQMPFGKVTAEPGEKEFMPMDERFRVIG